MMKRENEGEVYTSETGLLMGWDGMGRQNRTMELLSVSHPIPWDLIGFVILQTNSIEDRTYFYTVTQ